MSSRRKVTVFALGLLIAGAALAQPAALDDPMRPPGRTAFIGSGVAAAADAYSLTSTYITRNRKSAVINGKQVEIGQLVDGARVLDITPTEVRLRHREQVVTLRLLPISVKKPALTE